MPVSAETARILREVIERYGGIDMPSSGNSMFPFIRQNNICRFIPFEASVLKKGDIVLYHSPTGQLIAHRLHDILWNGRSGQYVFKGDSNLTHDRPVGQERLIGVLAYVQRGIKTIGMEQTAARIWTKIMVSLPVVSYLLNFYVHNKLGKNSGHPLESSYDSKPS